MKTPKDWIRFETHIAGDHGGYAMVDIGLVFGVQAEGPCHFVLVINSDPIEVTKETAEEVVELVAKYRESR